MKFPSARPARAPWRGHLAIFAGVAVTGYAAVVGTGIAKRLADGRPIDTSVLTTLPLDPFIYWFAPLIAAIFAFEAWHLGWRDSPLHRLLFSRSPSHRSDVFYFACDLFALSPMLVVALTLGLSAAIDAWLGAPRAWRPAAELPLWFAVPLFFLAEGVATYWVHRFMHTPLMWPLHAVHHAADEMTAVTTVRHHPLDGFIGDVPVAAIAALLAFPADALFVTGVLNGVIATVLHTRLPIPGWFERHVIAGPRFHGIHHSVDPADHNSNLAVIPLLDRLFGTFRWHDRPLTFGTGDAQFDSGRPLRDIGTAIAIWLGNMHGRVTTAELPATMRWHRFMSRRFLAGFATKKLISQYIVD